MRLSVVERGHRLRQKLKIWMIRIISRERVPDVIRTLLHRPEFFGRPFSAWVQAALRGPSEWSIGERELFAAFTSRLNQCSY
jgi:hypothetical protein